MRYPEFHIPARRRQAVVLALLLAGGAADADAASRLVPLQGITPSIPGADGDTLDMRVSHDGSRELYLTRASNLVPGTVPGRVHLILREGNTLRPLVTGLGGAAPNGDALAIAISGDGEYATFTSRADNLVAGDGNGEIDLFRVHIDSGAITRFPRQVLHQFGAADTLDMNTDGSRACMTTRGLLAIEDTDNLADAYLLEFDPPARHRMSGAPNGANGNRGVIGACRFAADDAGGDDRVVFASNSFNLVPDDTNGNADIFMRNLGNNSATRISFGAGNVQTVGGDNSEPWLVRHGGHQQLVWRSCATNIVDDDTNGQCDVFHRRMNNGVTRRLSRDNNGELPFGSSHLRVSPDGRVIAFQSGPEYPAPPTVQRDRRLHVAHAGANGPLVFDLVDAPAADRLQPAALWRVAEDEYRIGFLGTVFELPIAGVRSVAMNAYIQPLRPGPSSLGSGSAQLRTRGTETVLRSTRPDGDMLGVALAADDRHLAFYSLAGNLADTQNASASGGAFVLDLADGTLQHLSQQAPEVIASELVGDVRAPAISADGSRVAFVSTPLLPQDTHLEPSVYVWTRGATPALRLASVLPDGTGAIGHSAEPDIDAAGELLVYSSDAHGIVDDAFGRRDIYLHDLVAGSTIRLSESVSGRPGDGESFDPHIDDAGRTVIFCSRANDLVAFDGNPGADLFSVDLATGIINLVEAGSGDTCHADLSGSGEVALLGGLFVHPPSGATPGGIGTTELGFRPSLDFAGRFAAGIETVGGGAGSGTGLVRLASRRTLTSSPVPIAPSGTPDTALAGQQGHLDLSRDGRVLYLTSRHPLDPEHAGATRLRNLYRNLPRHVFFDQFE